MKKNCYSTLLLTLLLSMMSTKTFAYNAVIDGIYYNLIGYVAEVTYNDNFYFNSYSGDVVIPDKVTRNGVEYPVESIGENAFRNCNNLRSITIPNSVTVIKNSAFYGCRSLTSINIPNGVTDIEVQALSGCTSLTSVTIPNSVTSIENNTFYGCTSLTSITIPNSVTSIGGSAFRDCSSLTSIDIPNSVTKIEGYTFCACTSLTSVTIPNSVTSIGSCAFLGCTALTSITIPKSVTSIESQVFAKCSKLEEVYCYAETLPSTNTDAFQNSNTPNAILYVPASAIDDYKATRPWSEFGIIKAISGTSVQAVKESVPVLISANNGLISVKGELDGEPVAVYTAEGKLMGSGTISGGLATVSTTLRAGTVAVVKVGRKAVKVVMR